MIPESEKKYYPSYHFRPDENWMNDPNGLVYENGWYHLFFQYNPGQDIWGDIHWGHARSRDLIHWEILPIALSPSVELGEVHCYSGCAVNREEKIFLFYTSIGEGERGPVTGAEQWSAVSQDPDHIRFEKYRTPALKADLHAPYHVTMWRDPFIWQENGMFYMLLGGTMEDVPSGLSMGHKHGVILLYRSPDLEEWKFESVFYESKEYELVECPNILKFNDEYLLLYSPLEAIRYAVGTIDPQTRKFVVKKEGIFDYSIQKKGFYASNFYLNRPDGEYICLGCLFEGDRLMSGMKRGWAGMQSLPRHVWLEEDEMRVWPARECRLLRKQCLLSGNIAHDQVMEVQGRALEFRMTLRDDHKSRFYMELFCSEEEGTVLIFDFGSRKILLDRSFSSLYEDITKEPIHLTMPETTDMTDIDIFLDHSSIEVFFDRSCTVSARVFPSREESVNHYIKKSPMDGKIEVFEMSLQ